MKILVMLFLSIPVILSGQRFSVNFENNVFSTWPQNQDGRREISLERFLPGKLSLHHAFDNIQPAIDRITFRNDLLKLTCSSASLQFSQKYLFGLSSKNYRTIVLTGGIREKRTVDQGNFTVDTILPRVEEIEHIQSDRFDIQFNKYVRFPDNAECCVEGIGCGKITRTTDRSFTVHLPFYLVPGHRYSIHLPLATDLNGNRLKSDEQNETLYYPSAYDVLFTEIMADPSPPVLLPDAEYVEITNVSAYAISLDGWQIEINKRRIVLPDTIIGSHESIIICDAEFTNAFGKGVHIIGIKNFPAINNNECLIILTDASGMLIHSVNYSSDIYTTTSKKGGGWSVEMTNFSAPCKFEGNWRESTDPHGGTPGKTDPKLFREASILRPEIWRAAISDSGSLIIYFSEPMDSLSLTNRTFYSVNNFIGNPVKILPSWPLASSVDLTFSLPFANNTLYKLSVTTDPCNCSENKIIVPKDINFGKTMKAVKSDVVINEIMYDPADGLNEYIELYNRSHKIIDLKKMKLQVDDKKDHILTEEYFPMVPGSYAVVAPEIYGIDSGGPFAHSELVVKMKNMPSLPDQGGKITLFGKDGNIIDEVNYLPFYHHLILHNTKGVALERISPDHSGMDPGNWQSASSDVNYQTPGRANSQRLSMSSKCSVTLTPKSIKPNSYDPDDELTIHYRMDHPGYMARVFVFDPEGRKIATICNGVLLGTSGNITYDGEEDSGVLPVTGYYILFFQAYDSDGNKFQTRKSFVEVNQK